MGLIRKSLRIGTFLVAPIPAGAGLGPKGESKKQRYLRQTAEATGGKPAPSFGQSGYTLGQPKQAAGPDVVGTQPAAPPANAALNIAQERYARGEISREEFLQIKQDLAK